MLLASFSGPTEHAGNDLDTAKTVVVLTAGNKSYGSLPSHLSSLAGMGYVTQVGSALVSMTPMVGILFSAHSWSKT